LAAIGIVCIIRWMIRVRWQRSAPPALGTSP
jgi:hypothetical protein